MKFVCLGYADEKLLATLPKAKLEEMMEACFQYDDELRRNGHFIGGEALQAARKASTLRFKEGKVVVTDGPYAETKEQLGGILLLEARNLEHAVQLMSKHPGVHFGPWEIRPADETINALVAERSKRVAKKA